MKIAIRGHKSKGKEVIQILENLGGINIIEYKGCEEDWWYYICPDDNYILYSDEEDLYEFKLYTLEEFEKEFPFKIGDKVTITGYIPYKVIALEYYNNKLCYKLDNCLHYVPEILKPYKEMEERNITLTLEKAKEWYKKGGELKEVALRAFSEQELNPLPKSWEEFCKQGNPLDSWRYAISIKYEALFKLEQLRDCWWNGWEPEYNCGTKYTIKWDKDDLIVATSGRIRAFLIFPTREMAEEFLECFRDLIEKARDLI